MFSGGEWHHTNQSIPTGEPHVGQGICPWCTAAGYGYWDPPGVWERALVDFETKRRSA